MKTKNTSMFILRCCIAYTYTEVPGIGEAIDSKSSVQSLYGVGRRLMISYKGERLINCLGGHEMIPVHTYSQPFRLFARRKTSQGAEETSPAPRASSTILASVYINEHLVSSYIRYVRSILVRYLSSGVYSYCCVETPQNREFGR